MTVSTAGEDELVLLLVGAVLAAFLGVCLAPVADFLRGGPILGGVVLCELLMELPAVFV